MSKPSSKITKIHWIVAALQ